MERARKMMEMMRKMSEEEKMQMMERCFVFMKGEESGKERERDREKKEESARFPDAGRTSECCPGMMETILLKMQRFCEEAEKEK